MYIDTITYKKELAYLKKLANSHEKQDINSRMEISNQLLIILNLVKPTKTLKNIQEVAVLNLVQNIEVHDDKRYIEKENLSKNIVIIVLESKCDKRYNDSPHYNSLYTNGKFINLVSNCIYTLDVSTDHAVMVDKKLLAITVWFSK